MSKLVSKSLIFTYFAYFWPFLAKLQENQALFGHLIQQEMKKNIRVTFIFSLKNLGHLPGLEPWISRILVERDNHYTTGVHTDVWNIVLFNSFQR